ncbi:MAG: hypothetical protein ABR976_11310 [Terracidiphilus sp.]|jgi:hypothetical protein
MAEKPATNLPQSTTLVVVAAFLLLAAVIALVTGISLLFPNPVWNSLWNLNRPAYIAFEKFGRLSGVLLLAVCAGACAAGVGLLRRRRWAWLIAVTLFAMNGLGDLASLFLMHDLVKGFSGLLVAGVFLYLLTRPGLKRALH